MQRLLTKLIIDVPALEEHTHVSLKVLLWHIKIELICSVYVLSEILLLIM